MALIFGRLDRSSCFASVASVKFSDRYFRVFAFRFFWPDATDLRLH